MIKAMKGLAALALAAAMLAGPASAQNAGFYIGATYGQSEGKDVCSELAGASSCDEKDTAWRILGGFQFNRHLAAEVGYTDLGKGSADAGGSVTFEAAVWELVGVLSLPLGDTFAAYGKVGMYMADTDFKAPGDSASESNNDLTYGVGLQWNMTKNLGLRGEWQRYDKVGGTFSGINVETDIDVLSLGAILKF